MKASHLIFGMIALFSCNFANAQEITATNEYNEFSVRPIRNADIMHKNTVWMKMDLREKINEPFFATDNEITKIIIQAVKDGVLRPYTNDNLNQRMTLTEFNENLQLPTSGAETDCCGSEWDDEWTKGGTEGWPSDEGTSSDPWDTGSGTAETEPVAGASGSNEFFAKQITTLEMKVDILFDRKRSRTYNDIQTITLTISGDYYPSGIDKAIATFSYKELVENVFRDNPQALWYNPQNLTEHRNLAEAFDLQLYNARIIKFANPKDQYIEDIYAGDLKKALGEALKFQQKLVENDANMYEN